MGVQVGFGRSVVFWGVLTLFGIAGQGLQRKEAGRLWRRYLKARSKLSASRRATSPRGSATVRGRFEAWYHVRARLDLTGARRTLQRELRGGAFGRSRPDRRKPSRNALWWARQLKRAGGAATGG